jgi:hypothetical protein
MAIIDNLYNRILEDKKNVFNFNDPYWHLFAIDRLKSLNFLGQLDKNVLYIAQLIQVIKEDCPFHEAVRTLTIPESNELYTTGEIYGLEGYRPFSWAFWYINLDTKYVQVFTSYHNDMRKSPKDNYAIAYEQAQKHEYKQYTKKPRCEFSAFKHPRRNVFKRLIDIVEYSKTHVIEDPNFKVHQDMSKYWGLINNKNFIDDKYVETNRPSLVFPEKEQFTPVRIYNDVEVRNKLQGKGYLEIKFDINGVIRTFKTLRELNDYFYSLIKYINEHNEEFDIKQKIKSLEKHYLSNKWPIPPAGATEAEVEENRKLYTLYQVSVQKFTNKIIVQADVQEYGIVYVITNYWENKYVEYRSV